MKKWSEKTWEEIEVIYNEIIDLPFIKELTDGSLSEERFNFYLKQDAMYISDYAKVLTNLALKLPNPTHAEAFMGFAQESVAAEQAMQATMLKGITLDKREMTPTCRLYTSYLLSTMNFPVIEVSAAAILPCFWIYKEVGDYIFKNQKPNNLYQDWINMYSDENFAVSNKKAISICDELAANCTESQQQEMTDAFVLAAKMEWMFWDSAYRLEKWPV